MNVGFCSEQLMELFSARARRRFSRGLKRKPMALIKRLRKAKKEAPPLEKPEVRKVPYLCEWSPRPVFGPLNIYYPGNDVRNLRFATLWNAPNFHSL